MPHGAPSRDPGLRYTGGDQCGVSSEASLCSLSLVGPTGAASQKDKATQGTLGPSRARSILILSQFLPRASRPGTGQSPPRFIGPGSPRPWLSSLCLPALLLSCPLLRWLATAAVLPLLSPKLPDAWTVAVTPRGPSQWCVGAVKSQAALTGSEWASAKN